MTSLNLISYLWWLFVPGWREGEQEENQQPDWFHTKAVMRNCMFGKRTLKSEGYLPSPKLQVGDRNNQPNANSKIHKPTGTNTGIKMRLYTDKKQLTREWFNFECSNYLFLFEYNSLLLDCIHWKTRYTERQRKPQIPTSNRNTKGICEENMTALQINLSARWEFKNKNCKEILWIYYTITKGSLN